MTTRMTQAQQDGLVHRSSGVSVDRVDHARWLSLERVSVDLRWETEPGWIELCFERPAVLVSTSETGGRIECRITPEIVCRGEYYGPDHLSLLGSGSFVSIHATEMRSARLVAFRFDPPEDQEHASPIWATSDRVMLRDPPLHTCASLLAEHDGRAGSDAYAKSLAQALLVAWERAAYCSRTPARRPLLAGERLAAVLAYLRDHLDESVRVDDLALLAGIASSRFGQAFQDVTGMSAQAWQMAGRVYGAQRLMVDDPQGSLADTASLAGFSDQSHFSRAFLKVVGISPTEWLHRRN